MSNVVAKTAFEFWDLGEDELLRQLETTPAGLPSHVAAERLAKSGVRRRQRRRSSWTILLSQFNSPIILLLLGSAVLSFLLDDTTNALIILVILVTSGLLSFWQESSAADAVAKLLAVIETKAKVRRDGLELEVPLNQVVTGDVVQLRAGDLIPGDSRILESQDLFVDEAALTGESFPSEKSAAVLPSGTLISQRTNSVFLGTHVVSGTATIVIARTGHETELGQVAERLEQRPPESGFERGLRNFGNLLIKVTLVLVIVVFAVNVYFQRPVIESLLFALALAVGMTPQLLPAITSVVLAAGAKAMAREQVIVKQLLSIENFGSMDVLCSDKTGTLTVGTVRMHAAQDLTGQPSDNVLRYAYLNAVFETGFTNPIDAAIREFREFDLTNIRRLDEIHYDFVRKRLSVLVDDQGSSVMITKGALANVLKVCTKAETKDGIVSLEDCREDINRQFNELGNQGFRVLGLAYRHMEVTSIDKADEAQMTLAGFLVFFDPPKPEISGTLNQLERLGIRLKIITGDNQVVATAVSRQVGILKPDSDEHSVVMCGDELRRISDEALRKRVGDVVLFAEIEPNQKERIILALKKSGHVVGYLGDGINDASALHAADVGISVASAVDVAREAAQVVLLKQDLSVLVQGVREGRSTFANTLKYVFVSISANFGYMFSMAVASLFLPFLPLLPAQILLINLLADFPAMTLATDSVDPELIDRPRRWDVKAVTRFMLMFGLSSSSFDFLTFVSLLWDTRPALSNFERAGLWCQF